MKVLFLQQKQEIGMREFDFHESLLFWEQLFPEIDGRDKMINNLKSFGENIDEPALQRVFDNQKQLSFDVIEKEMDDEYVVGIYRALESIDGDVMGWMHFLSPVLISCMKPIFNRIYQSEIVLNQDALFSCSVAAIARTLFQMSFRVLVAETNASREEGLLKGTDSVARATYFKKVLLREGSYLQTVYSRYPVLTDMMIKKTNMLCEYFDSILTDYEINKENIGKELNNGVSFGKIARIHLGEGDTHNSGKSVAIIDFENGKLVYKPRNLQLEQQYNAFIDYLNSERIPGFLTIKTIKLKNTGNAGWCEYVKQESCKSVADVRDYYTRIGELLAIFYLFGSTDFHAENIIACGADPMVIDLETLFSVGWIDKKISEESVFNYIGSRIAYSVKASAILPTILRNRKANKQIDLSGLSMADEQESPYKSFCIMDYDKDTVSVLAKNLVLGGHDNSVKLNEKSMESGQYLNEMLYGFENTYGYFTNNRDAVLKCIEQLFSGLTFRVLVRDTVTYSQILTTMYHPDLLQSFMDREVYLNRLFLNADEKHFQLIREEIEDMKRDDIPMFLSATDTRSLFSCSGHELLGIAQASAQEMLKAKIALIGEKDLCFQKRVIHYSYLDMHKNKVNKTGFQYKTVEMTETVNTPQINMLIERVVAYCDDNSLCIDVDGYTERSFIGYLEVENQFRQIASIGINLYDGNAGLALLYAALYKKTKESRYLETVHELIRPIVRYFEKNSISKERQNGLYNGCSGIIYLFAVLSNLLQDNSYKLKAYELLREMATGRVLSIQHDVIAGNAGAILVADCLAEDGDDLINRYIYDLANAIIEDADEHPDGVYIGKEGFTGYAHGTAGISHALYKAYKRSGDERILSTVKKMLAYERGQYDINEHNYRRSLTDERVDYKWCHGIPGILLNRLSLKEDGYFDNFIDQEIENGIIKTKSSCFGNDYCLCHGDIGNLLILQKAADVLHNETLKQQIRFNAEILADSLLQCMQDDLLFSGKASFGLMTGLAGIGYGMLELENGSNMIPSILAV